MEDSFRQIRKEVISCLNLKKYVIKKLKKYNIKYEDNPNNGLAIYFKKETMNDQLIQKYNLITEKIYSHIYIVTGTKKSVLDSFLEDYYILIYGKK